MSINCTSNSTVMSSRVQQMKSSNCHQVESTHDCLFHALAIGKRDIVKYRNNMAQFLKKEFKQLEGQVINGQQYHPDYGNKIDEATAELGNLNAQHAFLHQLSASYPYSITEDLLSKIDASLSQDELNTLADTIFGIVENSIQNGVMCDPLFMVKRIALETNTEITVTASFANSKTGVHSDMTVTFSPLYPTSRKSISLEGETFKNAPAALLCYRPTIHHTQSLVGLLTDINYNTVSHRSDAGTKNSDKNRSGYLMSSFNNYHFHSSRHKENSAQTLTVN